MKHNRTQSRRTFLSLTAAIPLGSSLFSRSLAAADDGQPANRASVDDLAELLSPIRQRSSLPALAAGVMRNGNLEACGAVGLRRVDQNIPVTAEDKFPIGSCTKAMTATLAAMFVEEGKLRWDSTLAELFSEHAERMNPAFREVTIEMLLWCQSGIRRNYPINFKGSITEQRLALLDAIVTQPPAYRPGNGFVYTGAGFIICAAALEQLAQKKWEVLLKERLLDPLGMSSAGFGPPTAWNRSDEPLGHILQGEKYVLGNGNFPLVQGPAGTVHCTIADYLKFADLHASCGSRGPRLLKAESYAKLHAPGPGHAYAMGWYVDSGVQWAKGNVLSHSGITYNQGNTYQVYIAPNVGLSFAMAANAWTADERVLRVLRQVGLNVLVPRFAK